MKISKKTRNLVAKKVIRRVDIGCGGAKQGKEWFGIDYRKMEGVDLVQDLEKFPWKVSSNMFDVAVCSHVVEHINPAHGIFISFMNECWRILKPGAEIIIGAPYATSIGMLRDPTHCNFINEETWSYFDPDDQYYHGGLYHIYSPLPWKVKLNTWHSTGNIEVVLVKRDITPEMKADSEYLRLLKLYTKKMK